MRLLLSATIIFFLFAPSTLYSATKCETPQVHVDDPDLTFVCDQRLSTTGISYYQEHDREEKRHHTVIILDLEYSEIVPIIPEKGLVNASDKPDADCSFPTEKMGLDGECLIPTQSIQSFYNEIIDKRNLFAVISGTFGKSVRPISRNHDLPFLYKKDGSVLFRGYEMPLFPDQVKRALIFYDKKVDVVEVPSTNNKDELITQFKPLGNNLVKHIITGLDTEVYKDANEEIGRFFAVPFDQGKKIALLLTDHKDSCIFADPFASKIGMTQAQARTVLRGFLDGLSVSYEDSVNSIVMFDGSGSTQAIVKGEKILCGDRRFLTNAFAIYDRSPVEQPGCNSVFTDVHFNDWHYFFISSLAYKCIVKGYQNGTFLPDNPITRAEFLKMVILAAKKQCGQNGFQCDQELPYNDMQGKDGEWFYEYVKAAFNLGLIVYDSEHLDFNPSERIGRAEAAKILVKFLPNAENSAYSEYPPFQDLLGYKDEIVKPWYYNYAYIVREKSIFGGYPVGENCDHQSENVEYNYFCPGNDLTRAEAAKIVYKTFYANER